jgi:hypothetical protein
MIKIILNVTMMMISQCHANSKLASQFEGPSFKSRSGHRLRKSKCKGKCDGKLREREILFRALLGTMP